MMLVASRTTAALRPLYRSVLSGLEVRGCPGMIVYCSMHLSSMACFNITVLQAMRNVQPPPGVWNHCGLPG